LLDQLEDGPWPSFVTDLKGLAQTKPSVAQLLGQLEKSYNDRWNYWTGTVLNLKGYGGGVLARYSDVGDLFPQVAQFHTVRVIEPPGYVYSTRALRELCDISEEHSAGILQLHGMTGDVLMLGSDNETTHTAGEALMEKGWDIGGSGGGMRTISCCIGPARCELTCYDTLGLTKFLTDTFINELHRPEFPYKFKFKLSGCANDCAGSMMRSDMPIIGTWRDDIKINQEEVARFIGQPGADYIEDNVLDRCPTRCMRLIGTSLAIDDDNCVHCMHCINVMHSALAPGDDRGVTLLIGGKRTLKIGDMMSSMLVPFMKMRTPEDWLALTELVRRIWDFWTDNALDHERVGEFIDRIGMGSFLDGVGIAPDPQMVREPRANSYIKFEEYAPPRLAGEPHETPQVLDKEVIGFEAAGASDTQDAGATGTETDSKPSGGV
ncbi:MAG: dissimilatory-type sulfite reductase subunit alpha, partial [Thermoleophilia bacterium]|nr:dissimilatory-type sulfite reductase subunit alpha [Thermoleophilia bacterium]